MTDDEYNEICNLYPLDRSLQVFGKSSNIEKDISKIKFWVNLWSIVSIVVFAISLIVLLVNLED